MKYNKVFLLKNSTAILEKLLSYGGKITLTSSWTNNVSGEESFLYYSKQDIEQIIYKILEM